MMYEDISQEILSCVPQLRGRLLANVALAPYSWLRVGGSAQILYLPKDEDDLSYFLAHVPSDIPITMLGVGSNLIIRDGGIRGIVIRLGAAFAQTELMSPLTIKVGAACLDKKVAKFAADNNIDALSFLSGIPGAIGGALAMNAGAHGGEIKDIFVQAEALSFTGEKHIFTADDMKFQYRRSAPAGNVIFINCTLKGIKGQKEEILQQISYIEETRLATQPIKSLTAGSTFKNPLPYSSWKLIDEAGGRGLTFGFAQMSEMHCNFLLNLGGATAFELESLGETIRKIVYENSGILLEWEVKRIGAFEGGKEVIPFTP